MHISVFCGAGLGNSIAVQEAARATGRAIAQRGWGVVYGGGHVGLMGLVADAALAAGGEVIGVIPGFMVEKELAHSGLTQLIVVDSMHERKMRMHAMSDAVLALPGGFGTLDELFELLTWRQIGLHSKPLALFNVDGFYDPLIAQADRMDAFGFLHAQRDLLMAGDNIGGILDQLARS
ncbi:MAG: TIGR00730 family Rossman fold protein [Flavobacteriales bacterium]